MSGFGDILRVDLTGGTIERSRLDGHTVDSVLLGRGYNSRRLLDSLSSGTEPLSPENPLLITCGLLTGSAAPTSARVHVSARSPQTGLLGSSSVGGKVGPALRGSGLQGIEVTGASHTPVYLFIDGDTVELRDAAFLWGLETAEAAAAIMATYDDEGLVMFVIGPAGEKLVPIACIVTQLGHAAGRTGMGAVMGSKMLKAVVVRPHKQKAQADPVVRAAVKDYLDKIKASPRYEDKAAHGTSSAVNWTNEMGMLGTRNYSRPTFDSAAAIDGTSMDRYVERFRSCSRCPVHCKAEVKIESGPYAGLAGERPDFEPIASWGSKSGLEDPEAVIFLHNLCDRLGLDSVSAGNAVAFGMELFEKGMITAHDTNGLELVWGDVEVMEKVVREMAAGEGIGGMLGAGVREAARRIGRGADRYAFHVKGLELTAFDPRGASATGLGYAVSSRGGDFTSVYARHEWSLTEDEALERYGTAEAADRLSPVGKAQMVRTSMAICAVLDSIGLCKIPALTLVNEYDLAMEARLVSTITGTETTPAALFEIGERILNIERLFNQRFGAQQEDDSLPAAFCEEPLTEGPCAGSTVDLDFMVREFYELMGWDEHGVPTLERLRALDLAHYVETTPGDE